MTICLPAANAHQKLLFLVHIYHNIAQCQTDSQSVSFVASVMNFCLLRTNLASAKAISKNLADVINAHVKTENGEKFVGRTHLNQTPPASGFSPALDGSLSTPGGGLSFWIGHNKAYQSRYTQHM